MIGNSVAQFEEMQQAHTAIRDIDRIINSTSETKLEDAWNVISEISKDKFDAENVVIILQNIRESLVKIYQQKLSEINNSIDFTSKSL